MPYPVTTDEIMADYHWFHDTAVKGSFQRDVVPESDEYPCKVRWCSLNQKVSRLTTTTSVDQIKETIFEYDN